MSKRLDSKTIDLVINGFDFHRVWRAMVCLDWKWYGGQPERKPAVPTVEELAAEARRLLESLAPGKVVSAAIGGLWTSVENTADGWVAKLAFKLEDSEVFFEEI